MVIDFHTHAFPEKIASRTISLLSEASHLVAHTEGTVGSLLDSMDRAGIDVSVILPVATSPAQVEKINTASAAINEKHPEERVISFGCMHPDYENYSAELERIKTLKMKGIKLHPVYQGVDLDDPRYLRILDKAAQLGLIVVCHMGLDIGLPGKEHCTPRMCREAVRQIGSFPFVAAHMGGWRNWDQVAEELGDTGVFLDTSFSAGCFDPLSDGYWSEEDSRMLSREAFTEMIREFGSNRIVFGTDSPWTDQAEGLKFFRSLGLEEEEEEAILSGNADRLLHRQ